MKKFFKKLWNDESGQGMTEYILLLVVIVAIALLFGDQIKTAVTAKIGELSEGIGGFNP